LLTINKFDLIIVMDNNNAMDVDDICDIDNNVSNEDEIHGIGEDVNANNTDYMVEEDHVPAPTGSEVNVISQVGRGKNKSIDGDHHVAKRLLTTKSTSTPTSKFMASAFKAARSNNNMDLVPQVAKGLLL
jgi:sorbitol-specific phosphotransferase system component IIA